MNTKGSEHLQATQTTINRHNKDSNVVKKERNEETTAWKNESGQPQKKPTHPQKKQKDLCHDNRCSSWWQHIAFEKNLAASRAAGCTCRRPCVGGGAGPACRTENALKSWRHQGRQRHNQRKNSYNQHKRAAAGITPNLKSSTGRHRKIKPRFKSHNTHPDICTHVPVRTSNVPASTTQTQQGHRQDPSVLSVHATQCASKAGCARL